MSPAGGREGRRRIWIVAVREIRERVRSRSFGLSTVAGVVLVLAAVLIPTFVQGSTTYHVGITGAVPGGTVTALQTQVRAVDRAVVTTRYATLADGERAVRDRRIDVLLVDDVRLEWRTRADSTLAAAIATAIQTQHITAQARRLGISSAELAQLLVPVTLASRTLGAARTGDTDAATVGLAAVALMYVAISFYAGFVLTGVVQEKASRVAEVLLARMPAREILAGKVLGIGAVGLVQLSVIGGAGLIAAAAVNEASAPSIGGDVLAWTCLWFVLGYLFYSVLYAALGATASRIEDAQAAVAPVTGLLIISYLAVLYAQENPDALLTVLLSYLPPTAPVVVTYRAAVGAIPAWQLLTSAALMVLAMGGLIGVAGRVYSGSLLRFGGRIPLRETLRALRGRRHSAGLR